MKRYVPTIVSMKQLKGIKLFGVGYNENPNGEWVKYEDVKELILRNELMAQTLFPQPKAYSLAEGEPGEDN